MKIRTLAIDGNFLLKRSYFGAKNLYTKEFGHIGALYSFITTVRKLIKENRCNKTIIFWDGENGGIHRHTIDPFYKANRKDKSWNDKIEFNDFELKREEEKKESILKQRMRIKAYAEELFLRQIEVDSIEADDIIATYCIEYHDNEEIFLYTNDRDFAQLLDLNITILFDNIKEPVNKNNFYMIFKYHYKNALTIKIICGDVSDNIEGVKGVKEPTLIKYFPEIAFKPLTVKDICRKSDKINEERILNKKKPLQALSNITKSIKRMIMNHKLMNLREPFLNEEAIDEIEQLSAPLSDEDRGSKNLYRMMKEDGFLEAYTSDFTSYVQPFYPVIINEKNILKIYQKKYSNNE